MAAKFDALSVAAILDLLQRHPEGLALDELARRINASTEATRALVDYLWTLGIPDSDGFEDTLGMFDFDYDDYERGHIRLIHAPVGTFELQLSPIELMTVLLGLQQLLPVADARQRAAIAALSEQLQPGQRTLTEAADSEEVESDQLAIIRSALANGHRLWIRYRAADSQQFTERSIDPLRLEARDRYLYLNAWCNWRGEQRWFRTDRILAVTELDEVAAPHPKRVHQTPLEVDDAELIPVEFAATALGFEVLQPFLARGSETAAHGDGRVRVTVGMRNPQQVLRLVSEHAGEIEVLAPAAMRESVRAAAAALLTRNWASVQESSTAQPRE